MDKIYYGGVFKVNEARKLSIHIDKLRDRLEYLIKVKECKLIDKEIIDASRTLNKLLNKYDKLIYKYISSN